MIEIVPTNTCPPTLTELERRSHLFSGFAKSVQLDIGDGEFVPDTSWPYAKGQWDELERMAMSLQKLPYSDILHYETHLMVEEPTLIGELLARLGCARVIAHIETLADVAAARYVFSAWKTMGASEIGLTALIDTPLLALKPLIAECSVVQLMSIGTLGRQGAAFEPRVVPRIKELRAAYPHITIAVDGGVSADNIVELVRAGATRFGVGSAISKAEDPKAAYEKLFSLAESALE